MFCIQKTCSHARTRARVNGYLAEHGTFGPNGPKVLNFSKSGTFGPKRPLIGPNGPGHGGKLVKIDQFSIVSSTEQLPYPSKARVWHLRLGAVGTAGGTLKRAFPDQLPHRLKPVWYLGLCSVHTRCPTRAKARVVRGCGLNR